MYRHFETFLKEKIKSDFKQNNIYKDSENFENLFNNKFSDEWEKVSNTIPSPYSKNPCCQIESELFELFFTGVIINNQYKRLLFCRINGVIEFRILQDRKIIEINANKKCVYEFISTDGKYMICITPENNIPNTNLYNYSLLLNIDGEFVYWHKNIYPHYDVYIKNKNYTIIPAKYFDVDEYKDEKIKKARRVVVNKNKLWSYFSGIQSSTGVIKCRIHGDIQITLHDKMGRIEIHSDISHIKINDNEFIFEFLSDCKKYMIRIQNDFECIDGYYFYSTLKLVKGQYLYLNE